MDTLGPKTRLADLVASWPGARESLVHLSPALAPPLVWQSVAGSATLGQVARVAGLDFAGLVRALHADGMPEWRVEEEAGRSATPPRPDWVRDEDVRCELDAERLIEEGRHPLGQVRERIQELQPGGLVRLISRFHPAPLEDVLRRGRLDVHSEKAGPRHATYVRRGPL